MSSSSPAALRAGPRRWPAPALRLDLAIGAVVVLLLCAPALFTKDGFIDDWVNHLWLTWLQSREIRATGHPSLFLNAEPLGVFYPNFAFYGGTLYAVGGYLMALTGAPVAVFVAMLVLSFVAAYAGTLWLARQVGIAGLTAHLPATIVVTGAYYLSLAYGRGSWPELVATSAIPLLLAAALRIGRRGVAPLPLLLLAGATAIWSGSHNITLVWGTIFMAGVTVCVLLALLGHLSALHRRRMLWVLGGVVLGLMLNGWYLLPDLAFAQHTDAAQAPALDPAISHIFNHVSTVFSPFRERATHSSYLRSHFTELPALVILWLVVAVALRWRSRWSPWLRRGVVLLGLLLIVLLVLLIDESVWQKLPATLSVIQFTFRLQTYIVMAIAGLTIVLLRAIREQRAGGRPPALEVALGVIVVFGLVLGTWQVWNSDAGYFPSSRHYLADRSFVLRYPHHTPPTWYDPGQFRDAAEQVVPTDGGVYLNASAIEGESTTQQVTVPPGEGPLATNIAASASLVSVHGLQVVGRTAMGFLALGRPLNGSRVVSLTVSRADTAPLRLGPLLTLLGALGLLGALIASCRAVRRA